MFARSLLLMLCLLVMLVGLAWPGAARAQVVTNAPATFFGSVQNYLTSSDTNLPVHGLVEVGLGAAYQAGVNIASDFDVRIKYPGTAGSLGGFVESDTRNAGVAGIIVSEEAGGGMFYIPTAAPDIELSAGLLGGHRFDTSATAVTGYLEVDKMGTANTSTGLRLGYEWDSRDQAAPAAPVVTLFERVSF